MCVYIYISLYLYIYNLSLLYCTYKHLIVTYDVIIFTGVFSFQETASSKSTFESQENPVVCTPIL